MDAPALNFEWSPAAGSRSTELNLIRIQAPSKIIMPLRSIPKPRPVHVSLLSTSAAIGM